VDLQTTEDDSHHNRGRPPPKKLKQSIKKLNQSIKKLKNLLLKHHSEHVFGMAALTRNLDMLAKKHEHVRRRVRQNEIDLVALSQINVGNNERNLAVDEELAVLQGENAEIKTELAGVRRDNAATKTELAGVRRENAAITTALTVLQMKFAQFESKK